MNDFNYAILVSCLLSGLVVGGIAFYFFKTHVEHLQQKTRLDLKLRYQKETLPIRIQAYERLALMTERLSLGNLLNRVEPIGDDKNNYEILLIKNIEQEFEHNLVQQIYVSNECWNTLRAVKNSSITSIRKAVQNDEIKTANQLREALLKSLIGSRQQSSDLAMQAIKRDLKILF